MPLEDNARSVPENNPLLSHPAEKGFSKGNPVLFLGFLLIRGRDWCLPDLSGVSVLRQG
jgi:hypothetical protein